MTDNGSGDGEEGGDARAESASLGLAAAFRLLANSRRRTLLECLSAHHSLALADLAEEVAVREHDVAIDEIPAEEVKRVYMDIYHAHLPKLEAADAVAYDQERDLISVTDTTLFLADVLERVEEEFDGDT